MLLQIVEADINNGGSVREIPLKGVTDLTSIAVDWIANNIYFLEGHGKRIDVVTMDGRHQRNILSYLVKPTDIALDPVQGYVLMVSVSIMSMFDTCTVDLSF